MKIERTSLTSMNVVNCKRRLSLQKIIKNEIQLNFEAADDAFYIFNVDDLIEKYRNWMLLLPRVKPHYAVKCNDNELVLQTLAKLGTGFDCASKGEIEKIVGMGVSPERIIYANPTKQVSHLKFAVENRVDRTTFDCAEELYKIKQVAPNTRVVLRIRYDSESAYINLGAKYGCDIAKEAPYLIKLCKILDLNLIGVSFHVGSGCNEYSIYEKALHAVKDIFLLAEDVGFNLNFVDIGGGFCGDDTSKLENYAFYINKGIDELFNDPKYEIIAEPGRYFVTSAFTLVCNIHSKRVKYNDNGQVDTINYFLNDGFYQSFGGSLLENQIKYPRLLFPPKSTLKHTSTFWGTTCDSIDKLIDNHPIEELNIGDFLIFDNFGAYSITITSHFNGFTSRQIIPFISRKNW